MIDVPLTAQAGPRSVITAPGIVPRVPLKAILGCPTCISYAHEEAAFTAPVSLSPNNQTETWAND
ncbi:hypothetical protein [Rhodopila sp.]|uniref:hypothetical protein n=1 Tax=Rhodopila sp. TaxID=2480087 RepID=UPI003D0DF137